MEFILSQAKGLSMIIQLRRDCRATSASAAVFW